MARSGWKGSGTRMRLALLFLSAARCLVRALPPAEQAEPRFPRRCAAGAHSRHRERPDRRAGRIAGKNRFRSARQRRRRSRSPSSNARPISRFRSPC